MLGMPMPGTLGMPGMAMPPSATVADCWRFWDANEHDEFHPFPLIGNLAIGLGSIFLCGRLFEFWRRRRRSLLQIHLIDVALAMTAIGGLLGWYVCLLYTSDA